MRMSEAIIAAAFLVIIAVVRFIFDMGKGGPFFIVFCVYAIFWLVGALRKFVREYSEPADKERG